ncbi:MAG: LUD domain-containing protein [Desulfamplus sp.]|nr:LUD domain-containing protein [Desulfamplus sp.]
MEKLETIKDYKNRIDNALENQFLRSAMDKFAVAYRESRKNAFAGIDTDALIAEVAEIKRNAIKNNDKLFEEFKSVAQKNGVHIHLAATAKEANEIIAKIAKDTASQKIIKSKSMTAEEIHLNKWLENEGLEVTETDLGEWIVQLRHEGPSHMVMPAIHLSRFQVAELFSGVTGKEQDAEIERLVKVARKELREKFVKADMGITGANFVIADTGTIGLVSNEGNARLVTTLPKVHVVLAGIDKLVPTIKDALTIAKVLPRNATGQKLTSYVTWITGPSEYLGDNNQNLDSSAKYPSNFTKSDSKNAAISLNSESGSNKREMHIVLLDNGRLKIASDPDFAQILQCVRCGACANVCPVYRMVGGHTLGYIYIGAIGLITTYFFHGAENAKNLVQNCTNCGACKAVCAAGIDLPRLIKEVHTKIQDEHGHPLKSLMLGRVLKDRKMFHALLRIASVAQKPFITTQNTSDKDSSLKRVCAEESFYLRHLPLIFFKEHNFRTLPAITKVPFRDRWKSEKWQSENFGSSKINTKQDKKLNSKQIRIGIFSGCVQDFVYPEQLEAGIKVINKINLDNPDIDIKLEFPMGQSCCGLPALMMGEKDAAADVAVQNVNAFNEYELDYIVTLCASCASHLKHAVPKLVKSNKADEFAQKVIPFSQFINRMLIQQPDIIDKKIDKKIELKFNNKANINKKVTWHSPCHLCRGLGIKDDPKQLIKATGNTFIPAKEEETCCGFGGSFSANFPAISREILTRKLDDVENTGADLLVTECPGCVMQLRGGALNQNRKFKVVHLAELLADI